VNISTAAAATVRGARPGMRSFASARNRPMRPASTDPAMIAARVANGPSVASAAGYDGDPEPSALTAEADASAALAPL
jgi:hypothetical protein